MAVMLHPNKENPERYRVWDKETRTQKYFPLTKDGKRKAEELELKLLRVKKARSLSRDLAMNKLFDADGRVKGMRRSERVRNGRKYEFLKLYAQTKTTELTIGQRDFEETYRIACRWLLEKHGIEETFEIRRAFKKARKFYWTPLQAKEESMPFWKQYFG